MLSTKEKQEVRGNWTKRQMLSVRSFPADDNRCLRVSDIIIIGISANIRSGAGGVRINSLQTVWVLLRIDEGHCPGGGLSENTRHVQ